MWVVITAICILPETQWLTRQFGGDGGIRTLDAAFWPHAPLAGECLRPLGHVSVCFYLAVARAVGARSGSRSVTPANDCYIITFTPAPAPSPARTPCAARARKARDTSRRSPPRS